LALLRSQSIPVLLCERDDADGNWEDLLKATGRLPDPPKLIVFSRLADESLWAKVLNLGGFDVLMTPFEPEEVLRVIFSAWSRWECDFGASTAKEATCIGRPVVARGNERFPTEWALYDSDEQGGQEGEQALHQSEDARPGGWAPSSPVERIGRPGCRSAMLYRQLDDAA
jgi:hypothetical protein